MAPMLSFAAQNKENKTKETELATLRQALDVTRDSLQNDIAQRWRAKQHSVNSGRPTRKIDAAQESQERAF